MNDAQLQQLLAAVGAGGGTRKRITPFSSAEASEWRIWRKNFETAATINDWADLRQRREASAAMEGAAARAVHDIDHAVAPNIPIANLLNAYENRFIPAAAGRLARAEFTSAKQRPAETVLQWHTRVREIFVRAYPARIVNDDQQLMDQFTNNLVDLTIQAHTLDAAPATFQACLDTAQTKQANQMILHRQQDKPALNSIDNVESIDAIGFRQNKERQKGCWYCGHEGHQRQDCDSFKKGKTYFQQYFKVKPDADRTDKNEKYDRNKSKSRFTRNKKVNQLDASDATSDQPRQENPKKGN